MSIQSAGRLGSWAYIVATAQCPVPTGSGFSASPSFVRHRHWRYLALATFAHTGSISCMSLKFNLASFALSFAAARCCYRVTHFENSVLIARGLSSQGKGTRISGYADEVGKERTTGRSRVQTIVDD